MNRNPYSINHKIFTGPNNLVVTRFFKKTLKISHNTIVCQGTDMADRERERKINGSEKEFPLIEGLGGTVT